MKSLNEPEEFTAIDTESSQLPEELINDPEFIDLQQQMRYLIPIRQATIKRYFDKYKYQKKKREEIRDLKKVLETLQPLPSAESVHRDGNKGTPVGRAKGESGCAAPLPRGGSYNP